MLLDKEQIEATNAWYCLECGKCSGICPVARYAQSFSPRMILIRSTRNSQSDVRENGDLWSCLTCNQCDEVCPWDIKYGAFIQMARQAAGVENFQGTCSHGGILQTISQIMTTDSLHQNRLGWIPKEAKTSKNSEYLLFTGCLPYFETLFQDIEANPINVAVSALKILNHFDIKPQLMADEKCCGHDFYWQGDIDSFKKLARLNLDHIKKSSAGKIITACPECYRTLKVEYPKYFGPVEYEVQHISEFLVDMLRQNSVKLQSDDRVVTFQDPCRLGRHMGVYDAPRQALGHIKNLELREMRHNKKRALCCGVSGWMNCSQVAKNIQTGRLQEARATGAATLITACAKCKIHFKCALQDERLSSALNLQVQDLTEFFAEHLQ